MVKPNHHHHCNILPADLERDLIRESQRADCPDPALCRYCRAALTADDPPALEVTCPWWITLPLLLLIILLSAIGAMTLADWLLYGWPSL